MGLSVKQKGVVRGMVIGALTAVAIIAAGILTNPFAYSSDLDLAARLTVAIKSCLLLAICLAISVGRLAKHRFVTPEDMDGSSAMQSTQRAKVLQSLLQNTLEQSVLAALVYLAWSIVLPADWLSVVPMAAIGFLIGRLLFFAGYDKGAPSRAIGFALAFYPSLGMLLCVISLGLYGA